jgi:EpsD family peptidyl-prolyl cis-trans isomerase
MSNRSNAWRRKLIVPCLLALAATATGCREHQTGGQVIATVNGQEITPQDLQAEARSNPALAQADTSVLLQRVIARALLAQAAHSRQMDRYPGYPSDIARLKQDFIAQRLVRSSLTTPPTPTPADLAKVMADNPYSFARRQNVTVDDITMQPPSGSMQSLEALKYPSDIMARVTRLSIPNSRKTLTLDTAKVPPALAAKLSTQDLGELFFVRDDNQLAAMTVTARTPVAATPQEQEASATQIFQSAKVQDQIEALVAQLRSAAKIVYTNGFVPPHKTDPASTPAGAAPKGGGTP